MTILKVFRYWAQAGAVLSGWLALKAGEAVLLRGIRIDGAQYWAYIGRGAPPDWLVKAASDGP